MNKNARRLWTTPPKLNQKCFFVVLCKWWLCYCEPAYRAHLKCAHVPWRPFLLHVTLLPYGVAFFSPKQPSIKAHSTALSFVTTAFTLSSSTFLPVIRLSDIKVFVVDIYQRETSIYHFKYKAIETRLRTCLSKVRVWQLLQNCTFKCGVLRSLPKSTTISWPVWVSFFHDFFSFKRLT